MTAPGIRSSPFAAETKPVVELSARCSYRVPFSFPRIARNGPIRCPHAGTAGDQPASEENRLAGGNAFSACRAFSVLFTGKILSVHGFSVLSVFRPIKRRSPFAVRPNSQDKRRIDVFHRKIDLHRRSPSGTASGLCGREGCDRFADDRNVADAQVSIHAPVKGATAPSARPV